MNNKVVNHKLFLKFIKLSDIKASFCWILCLPMISDHAIEKCCFIEFRIPLPPQLTTRAANNIKPIETKLYEIALFLSSSVLFFNSPKTSAPKPESTAIPKVVRKKNIDGALNFFAIGTK